MPDPDRLDYFRRRESAERRLAADATNPVTARIHIWLADSYARINRESENRSSEPAGDRVVEN